MVHCPSSTVSSSIQQIIEWCLLLITFKSILLHLFLFACLWYPLLAFWYVFIKISILVAIGMHVLHFVLWVVQIVLQVVVLLALSLLGRWSSSSLQSVLGIVRLHPLLVFEPLSSILNLGLDCVKPLLFFPLLLLTPTLQLQVLNFCLLYVLFWISLPGFVC